MYNHLGDKSWDISEGVLQIKLIEMEQPIITAELKEMKAQTEHSLLFAS